MKQELVKDWMSREVVTISPETVLPEAHKLLMEKRIRRLPVVKDGRLVGIVTRSDIRGAQPSSASSLSVWELNYLLARLKVEEIMTPDPKAVSPETTIGDAARLMLEHKIGGLPVVDAGGQVVGIITESDIFRLVVRERSQG
ncbi:MAG: CBS domain-containing protein [Anaerolineales bacterium]